jgi:HEAT repeat protein
MTQQTPFQTILDSLLDTTKDFPRTQLKQFSDLDPQSLKSLLEIWDRVSPSRKLLLLDGFLTLLDSDTLVSFDDLARALLDDKDPHVRSRAIRLLVESDDPKLAKKLLEILKNDPDLEPRVEAAHLLGEFVLLGELEELNEELQRNIEDVLMKVANSDEHATLRRSALEAIGYSSRTEAETIIQSAFNRADPHWKASALTAMGRSNDEKWSDQVVSMLLDEDPRVRHAAVQSAGELNLAPARPILLGMIEDEDDDDVTTAAIWSLSQIGGEDVRTYLEALLDQAEDEELISFIEDALVNLDFTEDMEKFDFLSLDEDDELEEFEDEEDEK